MDCGAHGVDRRGSGGQRSPETITSVDYVVGIVPSWRGVDVVQGDRKKGLRRDYGTTTHRHSCKSVRPCARGVSHSFN